MNPTRGIQSGTFGVTVVVGTLQRGNYLLDCVRDLLSQTHRPLEIMIVDQSPGSNPATHKQLQALLAAHPEVITYASATPMGIPAVRNYGCRHAKYEAILFVDDDIRCGPDLVMEHARSLSLPGVGFVAGGIAEPGRTPEKGQTGTFNRWTATPIGAFNAMGQREVDHGRGCNFSAWRSAIVRAGGSDELLNVGAGLYEETDLALRIKNTGYRVYFSGSARLIHLAASTGGCRVKDLRKYIWGLGHNRAVLIRRHIRWFQVPVALAALAALAGAYAWHYRNASLLITCAKSFAAGWSTARRRPVWLLREEAA